MSEDQLDKDEAVSSDAPVVKLSKSEGIFNGIAMGMLALYVLFIVVIIGSVLIYTRPDHLLDKILSAATLHSIWLSLWKIGRASCRERVSVSV